MKKTQLIVSILGLCSVVACTTDREEVNSSPKLNTSASVSVKSIRTLSDTLKANQSQKNGITTKAESEGEVTAPNDQSEIIPPGEVRPPKK
ncbi:hypothetical protein BBD31_01780 [Elizabethkingia anophelis]|uniref:hypothetical protein n=1 Tax=Elizabethkingia anophelis TaxID=1117645 RepID=UPI0009950824|nr:hypothetical protein [Elizabethkingia anophelis]AQW96705.1 hypothetical protein BBD31_01780 [Elizabethkingia anophelis]MDV3673699.1 hypothetical protein [Elizabethkingia anophelis]MDV3692424.1 hypothetical protein [Elizabethkingia anophelis]MDV3706617.1 hypothetical protein [Elizabethkingia anophelis]OPB50044.1 hypothetical protein BAY04_06715 [Elizabethkingia anophelis]